MTGRSTSLWWYKRPPRITDHGILWTSPSTDHKWQSPSHVANLYWLKVPRQRLITLTGQDRSYSRCVGTTPPRIICVLELCITKIIRCLSGFRKISKCPFLWMISIHPVMSVENLQEYFEVAGGHLHWSANVSRYDLNRVCSAERLTFLHSRSFGTVLFPVAPIKSIVEQAKAARSLCGSSIAGGSFHST